MNKLGEALRTVPLPDSVEARARAVAAVGSPSERAERPRSRRLPTLSLRALAYTAAALLAVTAFSFTPPGRAVAGGIGDLVGIGGQPTEGSPPDQRGVVIGTGEAPNGYSYEIVAETNGNSQQETCIQTEFPDATKALMAGNCLTGARGQPLSAYAKQPMVTPAPTEFGPDGEIVIQGMVPVGAHVAIDYTKLDGTTGSADAHIADLDQALAERIGVGDRAAYFLAILPSGILTGEADHPSQLTPSSVCDSLRRIHYGVTAEDGSTIADQTLADGSWSGISASQFLFQPPGDFTSMSEGDYAAIPTSRTC
jgi:hypothetical protein